MQESFLRACLLIFCLIMSGSLFLASHAVHGSIIINEVMQDPLAVSDTKGEWFELYNSGSTDVDITGWMIHDTGSNHHVITSDNPLIVPAGGYLVLGKSTDQDENGGVSVAYQYSSFTLGNTADEIILRDADSLEVDRVAYDGGPEFPDPAGASMELNDPGLDNGIGGNWHTAVTPYGDGDLGTPGGPNSRALEITDTTLPRGIVGVDYHFTFSCEGGIAPYSWSLSAGELPGDITLDLIGILIGIPAAVDTQDITIQVEDEVGNIDSRDFTLVITDQSFQRGDVTGDGDINVLDVLATVNHILDVQSLDSTGVTCADCNGDQVINVLDALGIINVILGISECVPI